MKFIFMFIVFNAFFIPTYAYAKSNCVNVTGKSFIKNSVEDAKKEAILNAKWAAIEAVEGVEIKAESIVSDMLLVDEIILQRAKGVVVDYSLLKEVVNNDFIEVTMNVCVEENMAKDLIDVLSLNNSVVIYVDSKSGNAKSEFENISANKMMNNGYIVNIFSNDDGYKIRNFIKANNDYKLNELIGGKRSNVLIYAELTDEIVSKKGEKAGHDVILPYNVVRIGVSYKVITKDKMNMPLVLSSGRFESRGMGSSYDLALSNGVKQVTERFTAVIQDDLSKYIKGTTRKVAVRAEGIQNIEKSRDIRKLLSKLSWVKDVAEIEIGKYTLSYSEDIVYLITSIKSKGNIIILSYTSNEVVIKLIN